MSIALVDALRNVDLQVGRTYRCEVEGHLIEVRVFERPLKREAPSIPESDIMLDAWTELPEPGPGIIASSKLALPDPPDIPEIPADEEAL